MASYRHHNAAPSPSASSSSIGSRHGTNGLSGGTNSSTDLGGNDISNVTATVKKSSLTLKSPRGVGVHSPLPPMIGGIPNHNGVGHGGSSNVHTLQNSSTFTHSTNSVTSSPSSSLSNLTGALSKRFTVSWTRLCHRSRRSVLLDMRNILGRI